MPLLMALLMMARASEDQCEPTSSATDVGAALKHYDKHGYAVVHNVLDEPLLREVSRHVEHVSRIEFCLVWCDSR